MANEAAFADQKLSTRRKKDWSPRLAPMQLRFPMVGPCCGDCDPTSPRERQFRRHVGFVQFRDDWRRMQRGLEPIAAKWEPGNVPDYTPAPVEETEWPDLYFIGGDTGPIKIGISGNPPKRLKGLQTSSPYKLRLLCVLPGEGLREPEFHERFAAHRLEGEWFDRHPDIMAEIERLGAQPLVL